ncbi:MAG: thioesterase family protein [Clostridiales bacterium]|nr:thioesterase family protein [Clostridiales bacterium]
MEEKSLSKTLKVDEENLAVTMGSGSLMVLATPAVVALMENAAAQLAQNQLGSDELTTVGTMISVEHTSPTPIGAAVTATAVLEETDGRTFKFKVTAEDKKGIIAKGTHTRISVNAEKFQMKADSRFDD